jgi:hypothetical protein
VFPEYKLLPWQFDVCPNNFRGEVENQRKFFDWAAQQLGIKAHTDWYKIVTKVQAVPL